MNGLTNGQWKQFEETGYVNLGKILSAGELSALQQRIDDIMLGKADIAYSKVMMQLDSEDGDYSKAGPQTMGFKGSTLNYRKIQELEYDPLFLEFTQRPLFRDTCARIYGESTPISVFRAMFMNKPANRGTFLPWHQDRWSSLDADPLLTVWTALDPATRENGCVQIIPGSHKMGVINPEHGSGFLTKEQADEICTPEKVVHLELEAGEVALLHNWVLHASDVNRSDQSRRAFSACYMNAATIVKKTGKTYPIVFGEGALKPETVGLHAVAGAATAG